MIEFNGYLSGKALEKFQENARKLGQNLFIVSLLLLLPVIIYIAKIFREWMIIGIYCLLIIIFPVLLRLPNRKKADLGITPKRIYTDGEHIVCIADKYTESRLVDEVSKVLDYGEFYILVFPFGRVSEKFVCQKNLLTKGSIEEFEALFEGKIVHK